MANVKTSLEKALEKAAGMGDLSAEEKQRLRDEEKVRSLVAAFFHGKIKRDDLWKQLRGVSPRLLGQAQVIMIDSLRVGSIPEEFQMKKDGILAVEALKERSSIPALEGLLSSAEALQREYQQWKDRAAEDIRAAIEKNPQMRMVPVRTPDGKTAFQPTLSVDEAVQAKFAEFLSEHEARYDQMFTKVIERLRREVIPD